jgi:hypothetical protein
MGTIDNISRLLHRGPVPGEQMQLPMDVPGEHTIALRRAAGQLAATIPSRLGSGMLFRVGVPVVAATTPAVISVFDRSGQDNLLENLAVGTGLGGAWGAMVGAAIPGRTLEGVHVPRLRGAATGMARGMLLAPAVSLVSKYVADVITRPIATPGATPNA